MRYQLIFQFPNNAFDGLDEVESLRETLRSVLADSAVVEDGELASSQVNIFVDTRDPVDSFARCKYVLDDSGHLSHLAAAFRRRDSESYTVIWPENSAEPFVLA